MTHYFRNAEQTSKTEHPDGASYEPLVSPEGEALRHKTAPQNALILSEAQQEVRNERFENESGARVERA
jgi:hypothetical protein